MKPQNVDSENKWAVAETPILFCLPFRHLFREPFTMWRFSFAASTCLKYTFASFRGKPWKEFPMFPGKHILKHLFPTCHVKVSKFYQSFVPPIASSSSSFTSSSSTPPSTTSSRSQWALPGLNRERQISVGTAGPQLRPPDLSGYSQTPRAPDHSGHCHSLSNGGGPSQLVRAFADLSRSFREAFADFRVTSIEMWIIYPYGSRYTWGHCL